MDTERSQFPVIKSIDAKSSVKKCEIVTVMHVTENAATVIALLASSIAVVPWVVVTTSAQVYVTKDPAIHVH